MTSCDDSPCFCMTDKTLMTTFELGRIRTCRFPRRSALTILFCVVHQLGSKHLPSTRDPEVLKGARAIQQEGKTYQAIIENGDSNHVVGSNRRFGI